MSWQKFQKGFTLSAVDMEIKVTGRRMDGEVAGQKVGEIRKEKTAVIWEGGR